VRVLALVLAFRAVEQRKDRMQERSQGHGMLELEVEVDQTLVRDPDLEPELEAEFDLHQIVLLALLVLELGTLQQP
jgi:hypothetical protein